MNPRPEPGPEGQDNEHYTTLHIIPLNTLTSDDGNGRSSEYDLEPVSPDEYLQPSPRPESITTQASSLYDQPYQFPQGPRDLHVHLATVNEPHPDVRPDSIITEVSSIFPEPYQHIPSAQNDPHYENFNN